MHGHGGERRRPSPALLLGHSEAEDLLASEGISLGALQSDWPDEDQDVEDVVDQLGETFGSMAGATAFFENLLGSFQRHQSVLDSHRPAVGPPLVGIASGNLDSATPGEALRPEPPDVEPTGVLARTLTVLLGGTLCQYVGDSESELSELADLSVASDITLRPLASPQAFRSPTADLRGDLLRSMRLALGETLESVRGLDSTTSSLGASVLDATVLDATAELENIARFSGNAGRSSSPLRLPRGLGDSRSSVGHSQVLSSSHGLSDATMSLNDTRSVLGESQVLGNQSTLEPSGSGEGFTGGLVDILQVLGETMNPEGGSESGLLSFLQQVGGTGLGGTGRQARQLGSVLAGQGLSEAEIQSLPRAHFERTEEQTCAVCLVAYQRGELLTRLRCDHCFHVGCIAEWMRRATRCPLCRTDCTA